MTRVPVMCYLCPEEARCIKHWLAFTLVCGLVSENCASHMLQPAEKYTIHLMEKTVQTHEVGKKVTTSWEMGGEKQQLIQADVIRFDESSFE